jgi:hypothetical protein
MSSLCLVPKLFGPNLRLALDSESDAHTAADAQRREPALGITLLHLVQQRHQDPRARRADRVSDRDRPTVHVHVPPHILVDRDRLRGKRLIGLD